MTQTIVFTDDTYFSDVLNVLLDQAVNQKLINNQMADLLASQEKHHDLFAYDNSQLTPFGQAFFDLMNASLCTENDTYTLTINEPSKKGYKEFVLDKSILNTDTWLPQEAVDETVALILSQDEKGN